MTRKEKHVDDENLKSLTCITVLQFFTIYFKIANIIDFFWLKKYLKSYPFSLHKTIIITVNVNKVRLMKIVKNNCSHDNGYFNTKK